MCCYSLKGYLLLFLLDPQSVFLHIKIFPDVVCFGSECCKMAVLPLMENSQSQKRLRGCISSRELSCVCIYSDQARDMETVLRECVVLI